MKYKIGDVVRVKSLEWYNENKDSNGDIDFCFPDMSATFNGKMTSFCGKKVTIEYIKGNSYLINEDGYRFAWTDGMLEEPERQLLINEDDAKELYKTASVEFKDMLEGTFGKEFFMEKVKDEIQASKKYGTKHKLEKVGYLLSKKHGEYIDAYVTALYISDVLNDFWSPDWNNMLEMKWSIGYNNMNKSFESVCNNAHNWGAICFKSKELAEYFIKQFPDICKILYGGTK